MALSRFQLLLGLTALSFTTITAGVGLMQTYHSALAIIATHSPGITEGDYAIIAKQANIVYPIGEFLLIVGVGDNLLSFSSGPHLCKASLHDEQVRDFGGLR